MKKAAKSVRIEKAAAQKPGTGRLVQRFVGQNGGESLMLTTPDNRLLLVFDGGGGVGTEARDVTLSESFAWYQKAHTTLWWADGDPGDAFPAWLRMVADSLVRAPTDEAKPASGEWLVARQHNNEKLFIRDGALELEHGGKRRAVSVSEALHWWLVSVEGLSKGEDVGGDCAGEFEFFQLLTQGIFVPMNYGELAAAKLCATTNNNGDLAGWAKAWLSGGIDADIDTYKASA